MLRSELRSRSHGGSRHATSHWVSGNAVLRYDIWSQRIRITHVKPGPILLQSKKTPPSRIQLPTLHGSLDRLFR
jgi:hypothetical protein